MTATGISRTVDSTPQELEPWGAKMPCKVCKSENLWKFSGELTASHPGVKNVKAGPVYVCQDVMVCLDCGFAEMMIPPSELDLLKKGSSNAGS